MTTRNNEHGPAPYLGRCIVCGGPLHTKSTDCKPRRDAAMASDEPRIQGHGIEERLKDGFLLMSDEWPYPDDEGRLA